MLGSLLARFRREPEIRDSACFSSLLHKHAAFISQKGTQEFVRAKAGTNWSKLMRERDYIDALEVSRWEAFSVVLEDVIVIAEGFLRPESQNRHEKIHPWLTGCFSAILAEYPVPPHRPQGWGDEIARFGLRLSAAQASAPIPPHKVAEVSGRRVYELLPIHSNLRQFDLELVTNNIRFNMIRCRDEMGERAFPRDILRDALGEG